MPIESVRSRFRGDLSAEGLDVLARRFTVSTLVVLQRLVDAELVPRDRSRELYAQEEERVLALFAEAKENRSGGGNFYNVQSQRLSRQFARGRRERTRGRDQLSRCLQAARHEEAQHVRGARRAGRDALMHLVDANVLIEAKNRYCAFDIAPGFWVWLEQGHRTGKLISIDAVRDELVQGDDELAEWARGRRDFFLPIDQLTVQRFRTLSDWARHQNYRQSALNEFSSDRADFLLIAPAIGHGDTVITNEQPSPQAQKRAKIPDACAAIRSAEGDP